MLVILFVNSGLFFIRLEKKTGNIITGRQYEIRLNYGKTQTKGKMKQKYKYVAIVTEALRGWQCSLRGPAFHITAR